MILIFSSQIHASTLSFANPDGVLSKKNASFQRDYIFSNDWFGWRIDAWEKHLADFKNTPHFHYLEIGVFEGRSLLWLLENILTHPSSKAVALDLFPGTLEERFLYNLNLSGQKDRVQIMKGDSSVILKTLNPDSFDLIYVDGGHTAKQALNDLILSWTLLKTGGLMIIDDYRWKRNLFPDELRPKIAVDAFITAYQSELEIISRYNQVFLKKRQNPCNDSFQCNVINHHYFYFWKQRELYKIEDRSPVELSEDEKKLLSEIYMSIPLGERLPVITSAMKVHPAYATLSEKGLVPLETNKKL